MSGEAKCIYIKMQIKKAINVPAVLKINGIAFKITAVAAGAFKYCTNAEKITIGKNVTVIGKNAFSGLSKLKYVYIKSAALTKINGTDTFRLSGSVVVKVPDTVWQHIKTDCQSRRKCFKSKSVLTKN